MEVLKYAQDLVAFDSVSRNSNVAVSDYVELQLRKLHFEVERLEYIDDAGVRKVNLLGKRGPGRGGVAYCAHNDVVPADDWSVPFCGPFQPTVRDGRLWGRGSCDMKGSLACALAAAEAVDPAQQTSPLYIVCSADEEVGMMGARQIDRSSRMFEEMVNDKTVAIIGEPTELKVVHAHKGVCRMEIISHGRSAHSSTAEGINANWNLIPMLAQIRELQRQTEEDKVWHNDQFDPPTLSGNLVIINQPLATNVTTSLAKAIWFLRAMPNVPLDGLIEQVRKLAEQYHLEFVVRYTIDPLWVDPDSMFLQQVKKIVGVERSEVVCYATDGGVLRRLRDMVVCGPGSIEQAHRSDEWIALDQLEKGFKLYRRMFEYWTTNR
jgi:acetylornithine deacetylase